MTNAIVFRYLWRSLLAAALLLSGCSRLRRAVDQPLPERDIVYQTSPDYGTGYRQHIGFIDSDGGGQMLLTITTHRISPVVAPVWTPDGSQLLFSNLRTGDLVGIARDGTLREYSYRPMGIAPTARPGQVVIATPEHPQDYASRTLALVDLDTRSVLAEYLRGHDDHLTTGTSALSGSLLVFHRWWYVESEQRSSARMTVDEITLLETETGEKKVLLRREGMPEDSRLLAPAISPDGQWVAYTADDGLYLIRPDGNDQRRIVPLQMISRTPGGPAWDQWPTVASWSPDSQWLVYHRCAAPTPERCIDPESYTIYKVNVGTLEEIPLVEGGVNPYWRLTPADDGQ